jgi:GH18 family chitinase
VDIDYEYPTPQEMPHYAEMLASLKRAIGPNRLLTSAVGLGHHPKEYDPRVFQTVDLFLIMSYDWGWAPENQPMPEHHAPDSLVKYLDSWDDYAPKSKIVFGLPFYARNWANWGDWKSWGDISKTLAPADTANNAGGYNFNGPASVQGKTTFTLENCYRGVMIWHLGQDLPPSDPNSLLGHTRTAWEKSRSTANCSN